ncbi:MAG: type IV pilus assembly protein PilM [bacterium]|nr:type IV pilus assembly protein PilM [bacterium]
MDFLRQLFGGGKAPVGGLDMGSSSLKMLQLKQNKDKKTYKMTSLLIGYAPDDTVVGGTISDPRALGDYIKQLIQSSKINIQDVVGVASGKSVVLRPIEMISSISPKELQSSVRFEADKYLPYKADEAMVRGTILQKEIPDKPGKMEVLLVAAPNEIVKNTQDVIKFAGLKPAAIDMEPFALNRALSVSLEPSLLERTVALINIGSSSTSINIYKAGVLRQSRTVTVAGKRFTDAIAQSLNISFDEAEKMKTEKGVIRVEKDAAPVEPSAMRIFNVILPVLQSLITEIQRSFDFYRNTYPGESIDYVALSGGTASFKNIDAYISNALEVKCGVLNPFRNIDISEVPGYTPEMLQELAPSLTVSVGLALRNIKA